MLIYNHPELFWLTMTLLLTTLMWIPYMLQLIFQLGPIKAFWDPTGNHPHDRDWAVRAKRAHSNAVENLVLFAPLVLLVHFAGTADGSTAIAAMAYFIFRAAHYVVYLLAMPVVRTLLFIGGFACQIVFAARLIGWI